MLTIVVSTPEIRPDNIATGHARAADPACNRRHNIGIGQIDFGRAQIGLGGNCRAFGRLFGSDALVAGRNRSRIGLDQFLGALTLDFGIGELCLGSDQRAFGLLYGGLERILLDAKQQLALFDEIALVEQPLLQEAGNPRPYVDMVDGLDPPDEFLALVDRLGGNDHGRDRHLCPDCW